ncbi:hypothetical protein D051_4298 [Vibrio parahaemolyticus VPCR-2010]|nr:hypothetical protein D051_4298 [Vibrio parahaemolyticus VPCR-2010]
MSSVCVTLLIVFMDYEKETTGGARGTGVSNRTLRAKKV